MITKTANIDSSSKSRLWWPFVNVSDDSDHIASITCVPPFMSEFDIDVSSTHVLCTVEDNSGIRSHCGLDVQYICNYYVKM